MTSQAKQPLSESSRPLWIDSLVFVLLVALGVGGRFQFIDIPNFTPIAAIALFAGFYFRYRMAAFIVPLLILTISNFWLPLYSTWEVGVVIYAAFLLPVLLGSLYTRHRSVGLLAGSALLPSLVFYATTNLAVWKFSGLYAPTTAGLTLCYSSAIPFYRWMLEGDVMFTAAIFGAYAVAAVCAGVSPFGRRAAEPAAATS